MDCALVADVGTVINPIALHGQLVGGFAFGLGQAVMEEVAVSGGSVTTTNLDDYSLPSMPDIPPVRVTMLTDDAGPGPFGAKSVGELTNPAFPAAVANAVADACGVRLTSLPITPDKIFSALAQVDTRRSS